MLSLARIVLRHIALAALLVVAAAPDAFAQQRKPLNLERLRPAFPSLALPLREAAGQRAVDDLGANLGSVASWYGKTAQELRSEFLRDRRLRVDRGGRLFVVDELEAPVAASVTPVPQQGVQDGLLAPLDQTFLLHSRPGAAKTIVLNFQGASITNTAWNNTNPLINAVAYDLDGNPTLFSDTERQRIQYIWQRVAEDYAPFDVNVTTEMVSQDRITRTDSADEIYGTLVVITKRAGVYTCSCGGVAYLGVFNYISDFYKPALVFYDALGNGDEKSVAEAISHEAGHNMGLSHDGTSTAAYYQGHGTDPVTGWAPIMGVGYYKPLVQFSRGEYTGANNREDDFAVAQSYGLPLRVDDYSNTPLLAAALPATASGATTSGSAEGVLETAGDADVFAISTGTGPITASVNPSARSPNADLVLSLLDAQGNVLTSNNPLNNLSASLSYAATQPGTYYLRVQPTGQGSPTSTGYSSYGSVGLYKLTASFTTPGSVAPVASFTATPSSGTAPLIVTLDASASTGTGPNITYNWNFGDTTVNNGTQSIVQKTYNQAGTYTAMLQVTDSTGLSSTASRTISVTAPVTQRSVSVSNIALAFNNRSVRGTVTVVNQLGQLVSGAAVSVSWSGLVTGTGTSNTNRSGQANFTSPSTRANGCIRLTVTDVSLTGFTYAPATAPSQEICR